MEIGLIRHFAVKKDFLKGRVTQTQAINWLREYDTCTALAVVPVDLVHHWDVCYSSQLPRAISTAEAIYGKGFTPLEALNEPSAEKIFRKDFRLPFLLWALIIRVAILTNHKSQPNRKKVLEQRIADALDVILAGGQQHILIVSHAFVMEIISKLPIKKGRPDNAVLYRFTRR
jgi:hypothetical protein